MNMGGKLTEPHTSAVADVLANILGRMTWDRRGEHLLLLSRALAAYPIRHLLCLLVHIIPVS